MHLGALPPAFAGLSAEDANDAASLLEPFELESGDVLMEQGEQDFTIAFLLTGHVTFTDRDVRIGGAAARDMLGEIELFGGLPRTSTVVAAAPTQGLALAHEQWLALTAARNPAVYNIERFAHRRLVERFRHFCEGIIERTTGLVLPQPAQRTPGFVERIQKMWGSSTPGAVDVLAELQNSPMFDAADLALLAMIAPSFRAERVTEGTEVVRQGQAVGRAFLVVEGTVDMYFMTGERTGEPIARLGRGDAFGEATLPMKSPSVASYFAHTDAVLLSIASDHFETLFNTDETVGSVFRHGYLKNLIGQLLAAQRRYVELEGNILERMDETYRGTPLGAIWRD
jgi:CRP-like cAMP-binding protein